MAGRSAPLRELRHVPRAQLLDDPWDLRPTDDRILAAITAHNVFLAAFDRALDTPPAQQAGWASFAAGALEALDGFRKYHERLTRVGLLEPLTTQIPEAGTWLSTFESLSRQLAVYTDAPPVFTVGPEQASDYDPQLQDDEAFTQAAESAATAAADAAAAAVDAATSAATRTLWIVGGVVLVLVIGTAAVVYTGGLQRAAEGVRAVKRAAA